MTTGNLPYPISPSSCSCGHRGTVSGADGDDAGRPRPRGDARGRWFAGGLRPTPTSFAVPTMLHLGLAAAGVGGYRLVSATAAPAQRRSATSASPRLFTDRRNAGGRRLRVSPANHSASRRNRGT